MNQPLDVSYKGILKMSLPIAIGAFIQFIVVLSDNSFLSQVDPDMMSGAGNSGLIYVSLVMIIMGLSSGLQILVARRNGENKPLEAGKITANTLLIGFLMAVFIYFLLYISRIYWFHEWINSKVILNYMDAFLSIRSIGVLFYFITLLIIGFYTGIAKTTILIYTTVLTAGINIVLDYIFIFGKFGFVPQGIEGAARATIIAEAVTTVFVLGYVFFDRSIKPYQIGKALTKIPLQYSKLIMKISWPMIVQYTLSLSTWAIFFFFVEKLGRDELQISHVMRNLYMLVFISAMGFGQTAKTYISTLIAEKRQWELVSMIKKLIFMNLVGILVLSHGFWMYPQAILEWFHVNPARFEDGKKVMLVVFFTSFLVSVSTILVNTVLGSGNTKFGLLFEIIGVVVYLIAAYYFTIVIAAPIYIVWLCDAVYFIAVTVCSMLYLRFSNWKYYQI